jgi:hypothetical protein
VTSFYNFLYLDTPICPHQLDRIITLSSSNSISEEKELLKQLIDHQRSALFLRQVYHVVSESESEMVFKLEIGE